MRTPTCRSDHRARYAAANWNGWNEFTAPVGATSSRATTVRRGTASGSLRDDKTARTEQSGVLTGSAWTVRHGSAVDRNDRRGSDRATYVAPLARGRATGGWRAAGRKSSDDRASPHLPDRSLRCCAARTRSQRNATSGSVPCPAPLKPGGSLF